jgi:two-component system, NtrC family, response regulator GlrR
MKTGESGPRILVVDDDPGLLELIEMRLTAAGFQATRATSGEEAIEQFMAVRPRVVISDLRMEGMDGHALFSRLHAEAPTVPVIMLTAHGTIPDAVAATQRGVFGFLTKPFDSRELVAKVAEALAISPQVERNAGTDTSWRAAIVSSSLEMDELLRQARRAADLDSPILISGPRGSGKELLARAIHAAGDRAGAPFVTIRCSELDHLAASPSALDRAVSSCKQGFLLLKEIEELPAREQARLMLVLRKQPLSPIVPHSRHPGARIVATATQPLDSAIRDGRFRADLFYALGQTVLSVPALSDRRGDIPALASHFAALSHGARRGFTPDGIAALREAAWPGNVGQLRSVVEQALALSVTPQVPATLVQRLLRDESERETNALSEARRVFEHEYLENLLETTGGNITRAARIAQRNRTEFYKLLARHNIDPVKFK